MSELIQVTTTTGNREDAERIATELVSRRLAGCVQISGPIQSTYRWKGQLEHSPEWLCTVKTRSDKFPAIDKLMHQLHPYDTPELIATPIVDGGQAYLNWLELELDGGC